MPSRAGRTPLAATCAPRTAKQAAQARAGGALLEAGGRLRRGGDVRQQPAQRLQAHAPYGRVHVAGCAAQQALQRHVQRAAGRLPAARARHSAGEASTMPVSGAQEGAQGSEGCSHVPPCWAQRDQALQPAAARGAAPAAARAPAGSAPAPAAAHNRRAAGRPPRAPPRSPRRRRRRPAHRPWRPRPAAARPPRRTSPSRAAAARARAPPPPAPPARVTSLTAVSL